MIAISSSGGGQGFRFTWWPKLLASPAKAMIVLVAASLLCSTSAFSQDTGLSQPVHAELESYFLPSEPWQNKTGSYRSPLRFADGRKDGTLVRRIGTEDTSRRSG